MVNGRTASIKTKVVSLAMQDDSFRQQLLGGSVAAKTAIESELGQRIPESLEVQVLEEEADIFYLVLPKTSSENRECDRKINWSMWLEEIFYFVCVTH